MFKTCSSCRQSRDLSDFHKSPSTKDRRQSRCKACVRLYQQQRADEDKRLRKLYRTQYHVAGKQAEQQRKANLRDPEQWTGYRKRQAAVRQATPAWLTSTQKSKIKQIYQEAKKLDQHHVDHIVPIRGENVCGLHVPWNLDIIPAKANLVKSNSL